MAKAEKIRDNRSDRPGELIFGIAISLLLHVVLWLGRDYWLQAVAPRQQPAPEIPVEFVEVPPQETKPPPETSRRAANDSSAGGEAKPQKPLTAVKPAPATPKTSNSNSPKSPAPKPAASPPPRAIAPTPPQPKPLLQKPATAPAQPPAQPLPQKTPTTTPPPSPPPKTTTAPVSPPPLPRTTTPTTPQPSPSPVAKPSPTTPPLPRTTTPTTPQPSPSPAVKPSPTTPPASPPRRTATAPTTPPPQPQPSPSTAPVPRQQPKPSPPNNSRQAAKPTPSKPAASGAASKLGGPVSLSSRSLADQTQAEPNTNRSNQSAAGIDARRDVDLGAYLEQLRQRVRRQWIPGMTQSSRRTVIHFAVNRSGQVSQVQIAQPSGFNVTDEAALNAVQRAAPFAPLPAEYAGDQIQIRFTFNINVSGELELWGGG